MTYPFRNLVFEGGGVRGIAYVGALEVLEEKEILPRVRRIGGTSVGAINATLLALGYSLEEQGDVLRDLDFRSFLDDDWGVVRDTQRLVSEFGWYKGDFFHGWISKLVKEKLGSRDATFEDLRDAGRPDLYVYGANLSTHFGEVFSVERTPSDRIADAVRISMSIPLFFAAVRNARRDVYVDGGVLDNYPVKLFDREKYIEPDERPTMARATRYYARENRRLLRKRPGRSPYCYNRQTLGFRLDTEREIAIFRDGAEPQRRSIEDFFDYALGLLTTLVDAQANQHLHSDDWQRTIYIDTLGVGTLDFELSGRQKRRLRQSGRKGTEAYFRWWEAPGSEAVNRPLTP